MKQEQRGATPQKAGLGVGRGLEMQGPPRLQISRFITFRNTSGQIVSFRSDSTSTWNNLKSLGSASVSGWDRANATLLTMKTFFPLSLSFFWGLCAAYRLGSACSKSGLPAIIKPLINEMDRTLLYGYFFTLPSQISNTGRKNGSGIISRR